MSSTIPRLILLGTGTPAPSLDRQSSGLLLDLGGRVIVFDHGPGAHHRLLEAGYRASDVSHLFLTHHHYDHIADVPRLLLTRWDHGDPAQGDPKVFGPPPLKRIMESFFGPEGAFGPDQEARTKSPASLAVFRARGHDGPRRKLTLETRELVPGETIEGPGITVRTGPARHVQPYLESIAYRFEVGGRTVVYSGDNGGVFEPFIDFARGCDVLIHMNHFLSGTELTDDYRRMSGSHIDVAETARQAGAETLVLTHLLPQLDAPGVKERMVAEMAGVYDGRIVLGEDLMVVPLEPAARSVAD